MHALALLLTKNFHESDWTDQEVGWAMGRGIPVVPVRLERNPYGFAAEFQWVKGSLSLAEDLSDSIVQSLLANPQTHREMRRSLVNALVDSTGFLMSQALRRLIVSVSNFTDEEKNMLQKACNENKQVSEAGGVYQAIQKVIGNEPST